VRQGERQGKRSGFEKKKGEGEKREKTTTVCKKRKILGDTPEPVGKGASSHYHCAPKTRVRLGPFLGRDVRKKLTEGVKGKEEGVRRKGHKGKHKLQIQGHKMVERAAHLTRESLVVREVGEKENSPGGGGKESVVCSGANLGKGERGLAVRDKKKETREDHPALFGNHNPATERGCKLDWGRKTLGIKCKFNILKVRHLRVAKKESGTENGKENPSALKGVI